MHNANSNTVTRQAMNNDVESQTVIYDYRSTRYCVTMLMWLAAYDSAIRGSTRMRIRGSTRMRNINLLLLTLLYLHLVNVNKLRRR